MAELRTKETHKKYMDLIAEGFLNDGCNLCKAPAVKEFEHWKIIKNLFPWDRISKINDIILPKRHITYDNLNEEERKEFDLIKLGYVENNYEIIVEATNKHKSIPAHFHKHLLILRDEI